MPIIEYECENCGDSHEAMQKISERPLQKCSICGGRLKRLMSKNTFHLKGTGWYTKGEPDDS